MQTIETTALAVEESPLLSAQEQSRLAELEERIYAGFRAFFGDAGAALDEIKRDKLYRPATWEEYCLSKWEMSHDTAERLIAASQVLTNLSDSKITPMVGILPNCERQCRPLAALSPDLQAEAWLQAVQTAPEGKITAAHVADTAKAVGLEYDRNKRYAEAQKIWTDYIEAHDDPSEVEPEAVLSWAKEKKGVSPRVASVLQEDIAEFTHTEQPRQPQAAVIPSTPPKPPQQKSKALELASILASYSEQELAEGLEKMGQKFICGVLLAILSKATDESVIALVTEENAQAIADGFYRLGEAVDIAFSLS